LTTAAKRRRPKPDPEANARRLLEILQRNLATATDLGLRQRLERAIDALKHRKPVKP
jgi:hypothetical protein